MWTRQTLAEFDVENLAQRLKDKDLRTAAERHLQVKRSLAALGLRTDQCEQAIQQLEAKFDGHPGWVFYDDKNWEKVQKSVQNLQSAVAQIPDKREVVKVMASLGAHEAILEVRDLQGPIQGRVRRIDAFAKEIMGAIRVSKVEDTITEEWSRMLESIQSASNWKALRNDVHWYIVEAVAEWVARNFKQRLLPNPKFLCQHLELEEITPREVLEKMRLPELRPLHAFTPPALPPVQSRRPGPEMMEVRDGRGFFPNTEAFLRRERSTMMSLEQSHRHLSFRQRIIYGGSL
ncbi:uncharacterized protein JCM6883_005749 [Sporobolomyces salmoneus]|uniref:uncharacterized protein n=1 Tax=Sporobolomyces salmoneus TaxID=183962 RepID=UPI0031811F20